MDQVKKYVGPTTRTLSINEWCAFAREGIMLPVRIQVEGNSMYPLIRRQKDWVTVFPLDRLLRVGDIVLYSMPGQKEIFVLHRVWKIREGEVQTLGDGNTHPDAWKPLANILGVVLTIERAHRRINPNTPMWRLFGKSWMAVRPLRIWVYRFIFLPKYVARRLARR